MKGYDRMRRRRGMAYVAILVLMLLLGTLAMAFIHKVGTEVAVSASHSDSIQAQYLAETAANHAMWRLLHQGDFPQASDVYYMHTLARGRYGYKVRRQTKTTFATIATVGMKGDAIVNHSYVLNVLPYVATGSYQGTSAVTHEITGVGFQPEVVIVKGDTTKEAVIRTSTMPAGYSKRMTGDDALRTDQITSLDSDGFTVGSTDYVNNTLFTYYWIAFRGFEDLIVTGTYTGNGISGRVIDGIGFDPGLVMVLSAEGKRVMVKFPGSSLSQDLQNEVGKSDCIITPVPADGFRIGDSDRVNKIGVTYHYVCFSQMAGVQEFGSYTGTSMDNRDITGLDTDPVYVWVRCLTDGKEAQHCTDTLDGTRYSMFFKNDANVMDRIQDLDTKSFQVGTDDDVNKLGDTYGYAVWTRR